MKTFVVGLSVLLVLGAVGPLFAADDFPLREKYPDVKTITLEDLDRQYDASVIVDARSKMEFDVVRIAKAVNVPVAKKDFLAALEEVRGKTDQGPLVFYCNGHTCAKSYKASRAAADAGFKNVLCFDAGIFEWVNAYPERGTLLGQTPADKSKLIAKADLSARKLSFTEFKARASEHDALVIDTRDAYQRATNADLDQNREVDLKGVREIPMDRMVRLINDKKLKDRQLLIFDAVGKQVRWLQYHLEDAGYRNYYFLDKGVLGAAAEGGVR